ncbi:MAG: dCTP deaminase domain-containing protein [Candidatus Hodarchaeales archaeon]|jgi:dUTP pyrophosphatase
MSWRNLHPAVWPGSKIHQFIPQGIVQPNGIDLSIKHLFVLEGTVKLTKKVNDRQYPKLSPLEPIDDFWFLKPGIYLVEVAEDIIIPNNAIGYVAPRSTLLRMGATVYSGIWDKGFQGIGDNHGRILLQTSLSFQIHTTVSIAQIIFISAVDDQTSYEGTYKPKVNT